MSESGLSLTYDDLRSELGAFLGFGRGGDRGADWDERQLAEIRSCVRSGQRQFLFPPPLEGEASSYDWSFLRPVAELALPQAAKEVLLPEDFGGLEGRVTMQSAGSTTYWPVDVVNPETIRIKYASWPDVTGRPEMVGVEPMRGTGAQQGQRFKLVVWPGADQAYTLQLCYYVLAEALTAAMPFTYGGMAHAETLLESCLAIAEQRLDDASGVHKAQFMERLAASVNLDRRLKPQKLGYNRDLSDAQAREARWRDRHGWDGAGVTFGGSIPG